MPAQITKRPITNDDQTFLANLYATTRAEEMQVVPWSEQEKTDFLQMQFKAQHKFYTENYKKADYNILMIEDSPAGRLYIDRRENEIRILDIALLPKHRGKGLGHELMQEILDEGKRCGKPIRIHVESNNPARRLYDRLGFKHIEDRGVYQFLEWAPQTSN